MFKYTNTNIQYVCTVQTDITNSIKGEIFNPADEADLLNSSDTADILLI